MSVQTWLLLLTRLFLLLQKNHTVLCIENKSMFSVSYCVLSAQYLQAFTTIEVLSDKCNHVQRQRNNPLFTDTNIAVC